METLKHPSGFLPGWYGIIPAKDLKALSVKKITLGGKNFVLYRTEDGKLACLDDICCHKNASLSTAGSGGKVEGDCIRCPYHGLTFDPKGQCKEIPSQAKGRSISPSLHQESFEVREESGFIWLKQGDTISSNPINLAEASDNTYSSLFNTIEWPVTEGIATYEMLDATKLDLSPLSRFTRLLNMGDPVLECQFFEPATIKITYIFGDKKVIVALANNPVTPSLTKTNYLILRNFANDWQKQIADLAIRQFINASANALRQELLRISQSSKKYEIAFAPSTCDAQKSYLDHRKTTPLVWSTNYLAQ